jgi:hypothetical protein
MTALTPAMGARHGSHFENLRALFRPICKNPALRKAELGRIAIALMSWSQTLHANRLSRARWTPPQGAMRPPGKQSGNAVTRLAPVFDQLECFAMFPIKQLNFVARVRS